MRIAASADPRKVEIRRDLAAPMFAVWGNADGIELTTEWSVLAMCGRLPIGTGFFDGDATLVGAVMCPAC